ncbi:helix-turn-helix transcriptional regulator [Methylibium sp.]|uniref:helix-turn-helix transcriptional regulator n=1 Tax=Methylibium sp. TaxID=2067992 RepID=UPI003D14848E
MTTVSPKASAQNNPSHPVPSLPHTGFVRQEQVLAFIPFSRSTLWRQVAAKTFPAPVKLTPGITAWRAEDIRLWIENRSGQA